MPIIPRVSQEVREIGALPQARNTTRVSAAPLSGLSDAVAGVVGVGVDYAQKVKARNDTTVLMQARRELSDWEAATFDPENPNGIHGFKGQNALTANEKLLPDLDKRVSEISVRLNSEQRARFDEMAFGFKDSVQGRLNTHMTREHESFLKVEQEAAVSNLTNDATQAALDGDFGLASIRAQELVMMNAAARQADGMPDALIKAESRDLISTIHSQVVGGMLATDPLAAQAYMDQYMDQFSAVDRARVQTTMQPYVEDAVSDSIVDDTLADSITPDMPEYEQAQQSRKQSATNAKDVQAAYASLGDKHGFKTTSTTRNKAENAAVGGVANSQHLDHRGTARDWSIKGKTKEQISAFVSDLKANGYEVITKNHGTGPHIHAEIPSGRAMGGVKEQYVMGATGGQPFTEGQALEKLRADPRLSDPRIRKAAEQKLRAKWTQREQDVQDMKRATIEASYLAIEEADPNQSARKILGPQFESAARAGLVDDLERRLEQRRSGTLIKDNLVLADTLRRESVLNPEGFAKLPLAKYSTQLSSETLDDLSKRKEAITNPKQQAKREAFASEAEQIKALVYTPLGLEGDKDDIKEKRAKFDESWYRYKRNWSRNNPDKEMSAEDRDKGIRKLTATFVLDGEDTPFFESGNAGEVPEEDQEQIRAAFKSAGRPEPTADEMRVLYLNKASR